MIEVSYNRAERNPLPVKKKIQEACPLSSSGRDTPKTSVAGIKALQQLDFAPYVVGIGGGGDPRLPELVDPKFMDRLKLSNIDYFSPDMTRASS